MALLVDGSLLLMSMMSCWIISSESMSSSSWIRSSTIGIVAIAHGMNRNGQGFVLLYCMLFQIKAIDNLYFVLYKDGRIYLVLVVGDWLNDEPTRGSELSCF